MTKRTALLRLRASLHKRRDAADRAGDGDEAEKLYRRIEHVERLLADAMEKEDSA